MPVNTGCDANLCATRCERTKSRACRTLDESRDSPPPSTRRVPGAFADAVSFSRWTDPRSSAVAETEWLDLFTGYPDALGQSPSQIDYFMNEDGVVFPSYDHDAVEDPKLKLDVMRLTRCRAWPG